MGRSSGGRAPRELRLRADAGVVLVAPMGATGGSAGVTGLAGRLLDSRVIDLDIAEGPESALGYIEEFFDDLLDSPALPPGAQVYGVGVGVPGPVEFGSGRPVSPPIMPGWDGYDIRDRLARRYRAPVWVDNDVNLLALGEVRIVQSPVSRDTELLGSAFMVLDQLFSPACLRLWLFDRSPAGRPEIADAPVA